MTIGVELIGWIATIVILAGYYLNAKQIIGSWLVWIVGNIFMLIYSLLIHSSALEFLSIILIGMNIYGYSKWRKSNLVDVTRS